MNLSKKTASLAMAPLLAAMLSACGGGSGSSGTTTPTTPVITSFPVQQALTVAFTHGLQSSLSITGTASSGAISLPVTGTLTYSLSAATNTTFEGGAAQQSTETVSGSLSVSGQTQPLSITDTVYVNAQYAPIGSDNGNSYCVATGSPAYPATASAGQTGDIAALNCYADRSKKILLGTTKISFVATAGSDVNTLNFQMLNNFYDPSNKLLESTSTTYAISAAGVPKITRVQISGSESGFTVNLDAK